MEKTSSVIAAFEAGKYPSSQQIANFIDFIDNTALSQENLSSQGRVLANGAKQLAAAYKQLILNKDGDNVLQEGLWQLSRNDITTAAKAGEPVIDKQDALDDIKSLQTALRSIVSIVWGSLTSEGGALVEEFAGFLRLSLADAAELIETGAGKAKESLREIEEGVQSGQRTAITGRDKERVKAESGDAKVTWEHGMDAVKGAGSTAIDAGRATAEKVEETSEKTNERIQQAYQKLWERAQSEPKYRDAVNAILSVIQKRVHRTLDATTSDSLSSLVEDPTPEKHITKALDNFQTFLERLLSGQSIKPFIKALAQCLDTIAKDSQLRSWFDDFIAYSKRSLGEKGFANSDEGKQKRKHLRHTWKELKEKEGSKWENQTDALKAELEKLQQGFEKDKDLQAVRKAHAKLGRDIEAGLVEAGDQAGNTIDALIERATWFWQDIFRVHIPRFISYVSHLPIPRTEYKDKEVEFVLENLDISSLNLLPSHVYIRNITDVDIQTSDTASEPSRTQVGTLTRIKLDAVQLNIEDVSFWYKDLTASAVSPSEFSGLVTLTLPPQGISVDLKVRLIPNTSSSSSTANQNNSREALKHFHTIENVKVDISEHVQMSVKESNHAVLLAMFKPIYMMRLRDALERALEKQIKMAVEWMDGVAWDVIQRKQVLEDTGVVSGGGALIAAIWSELGRMKRVMGDSDAMIGVRTTGTGVVFEQRRVGHGTESTLAVGGEPQVLSGEKQGPLGTASEPLSDRMQGVVEQTIGMDVDDAANKVKSSGQQLGGTAKEVKQHVEGAVKQGKKQVLGFKRSVEEKTEKEKKEQGWRSHAFDV